MASLPTRPLVLLTLLCALPACSGGGGGTTAGTTSFQLESLSLSDHAVWEINRAIRFTFTESIDFASVSSNTIHIRSLDDVPAVGVFRLLDERTVEFQPTCPTREDLSDAGFAAGGVEYVLNLPGRDTSANVLRSRGGVPLGLHQTRTFRTPDSTAAAVAFQDLKPGPPAPVLRALDALEEDATYVEVGGAGGARVYFERTPAGAVVLSEPDFVAPLNLYSDAAARLAFVLEFDQPVNPSQTNLSGSRLGLEFLVGGVWSPIDVRVVLEANCTETGARVRLEPIGVLPQASEVRVVVQPGFQDLVGESTTQARADFARVATRTLAYTSLTPADGGADGLHETFTFGGESPFSLEDTDVLFDAPSAKWGAGKLASAFDFAGTGGPGGTFDWVIHAGERVFFDTTAAVVLGGPDGAATTSVTFVNGQIDVNDLVVEEGGYLRFQGPNTVRIHATGSVRIEGEIDLSGFGARDLTSFDTGNLVEQGGSGAVGGGDGGDANLNTSGSSSRGGRGEGPFGTLGLGGIGGETAYLRHSNEENRRPGGGGGGRFAPDVLATLTANSLSLAAGPGVNGNPAAKGAESNQAPAAGGGPGSGPFLDSSADNDVLGVRPVLVDGELTGLLRGELSRLWAGYGGGGGGNAVPSNVYPNPNWDVTTDEKGGGGGGGAGGLQLRALGVIEFGPAGLISANGGRGGLGENTGGFNRIGGTGGGGSGGHIVLESATRVDFTGGGRGADLSVREFLSAGGPRLREGPSSFSHGGPGGGGVVQVHVPDVTVPPGPSGSGADLVLPDEAFGLLDPLDHVSSPPAVVMIPTFSKRSKARSQWLSIGGADRRPDGSESLLRFLFGGLEPASGEVRTESGAVVPEPALVAVDDVSGAAGVRLLADGFTLELSGAALAELRDGTSAGLSNDLFLRTPALLAEFAARLFVQGTPAIFEEFTIASAAHDEGTSESGDELLTLVVSAERGTLDGFAARNPGATVGFELRPRYFRLATNGLADSLPVGAVRIRFQAARANERGAPDEDALLVPWTSDLADFNGAPPGVLQFFRFEVEFDLATGGAGPVLTPTVELGFLKLPFLF